MERNPLRLAIVFSLFLVGLYIAGYFYPSGLHWGFHFLGFLPIHYVILYPFLIVATIFTINRCNIDTFIAAVSAIMERKPLRFLIIVIGVFVIAAYLLRVKAPLLGDSMYLAKNYSEASRGIEAVDPRNEPIATYYFYSFMDLFKVTTYKKFLDIFLIADLVLGIGFIIAVFISVRLLFSGATDRFLSFCSVLVLPYMQLFFGYVETYPVTLFGLSLYILVTILLLKRKIRFYVVAITFLLLTLVHYLTVLLLPSLLYLAYREAKNKNIKDVFLGFWLSLAGVILLLFAINFQIDQYYAHVPHKHYLPLVQPSDYVEIYSSAYTLFSAYHAIDLLNLLLLLCPTAFFLITGVLLAKKQSIVQSTINKFLLAAIVPVILFILVAKFDLGTARDWDIAAPYAYIISLLAVLVSLNEKHFSTMKTFTMIIVLSLMNSLIWFTLNATADSSINRYKALLDQRIFSQAAMYSGTLNLSLYYHQIKDIHGPIDLWNRYISIYPDDHKGYTNVMNNLKRRGGNTDQIIVETFDRWMQTYPNNAVVKQLFLNFSLDTGNRLYHEGKLMEAEAFYRRALSIDSTQAKPYNNLGSVYAERGEYRLAIDLFQKALSMDSLNTEAYYNLGQTYAEQGDTAKGVELFKRAAHLGNTQARDFLKRLGHTW
ncbi:MAG: tetratricopeptide repeat protein [Ignavibacteriae bacterium]|nr:tetratricopeptide repeat protein [Ignavibacteriota bacterium]